MTEASIDRTLLAVAAWLIVLIAGLHGISGWLGLKYLQEVEWPTDLYALAQLNPKDGIDVAVVGSSRSHYGLPPSALDRCLSDRVGRRTRTVSLNRLTASAYAEDAVALDLLGRAPKLLVVEVAPETLNASHFELDYNIASTANLSDVPACVADSLHPDHLASCARPIFRPIENVAQTFDRRSRDNAHINWMMLYEGGGQYCYGTPACDARNARYDEGRSGRFEERLQSLVPTIAADRFGTWDIDRGLPRTRFEALVRRATAAGTHVFVVNLPVHVTYQTEVPPAAYAKFVATMNSLANELDFEFIDRNTPDWQGRRGLFLDPDHLNHRGAERMARGLCADVLAPALQNWK